MSVVSNFNFSHCVWIDVGQTLPVILLFSIFFLNKDWTEAQIMTLPSRWPFFTLCWLCKCSSSPARRKWSRAGLSAPFPSFAVILGGGGTRSAWRTRGNICSQYWRRLFAPLARHIVSRCGLIFLSVTRCRCRLCYCLRQNHRLRGVC